MEEAQYIRGPADPARINLEDEHELVYWTKLLRVSETKLRVAVAFAGVMTSDVRDYLGLPSVQSPVAPGIGLSAPIEARASAEVVATPAAHQPQVNVRSLNNFTRFSHVLLRAR